LTAGIVGGAEMADVVEGASLPDGIDVDETSAYFGITQSSDIVHQLMSIDRNQSIGQFFSMVSDIVLKPGEFDFEEASKVLNCEGGEIYYLVSGHFGLMSFSDPLLHYLGLQNSLGEDSPNAKPSITDQEFESLKRLSDPMNILKLLAIANNTGGSNEVVKYFLTMDEIFQDVESNVSVLVDIAEQFDASLDVIGHAIPVTTLANSKVKISNEPSVVKPAPAPEPKVEDIKPEPVSPAESEPSIKLQPPVESVPLPGQKMVKDEVEPVITQPPVEQEINERRVAKVTDNAFEGAFGISNEQSSEIDNVAELNSVQSQVEPEEDLVSKTEDQSDEAIESNDSSNEVEQEEVFVSAAEIFVQADSNDDGVLSVEELSQASGLSLEESKQIHETADKDDDGKMSLSEFISSPAAEKIASNLPRPVAPVRRPVKLDTPKPSSQQSNATDLESNFVRQNTPPQPNLIPKPMQKQNIPPQPISRPQPINQMPQQQFVQQIQPTIRSGVTCRGCGIGIDPFWRFCPICGGQNLG